MATYTRPFMMRNPIITIDGVVYSNQVQKARLVPDTPTVTYRTFDGVLKDRDTTSWTLELGGIQDRGAAGLAAALDEAAEAGDPVEMEIQTKAGSGQDLATFTFIPIPVEFGGESGAAKTFDATFEVVDQPAFTQSA
jgi:hypothetical protein